MVSDPLPSSPPHGRPCVSLFLWLSGCAFLVCVMVIVGAITRLTDSGLSMVEWRPLIGALPPLSQGEWVRVFDLYKATPEFIHHNFWMSLSDFKSIFFWEWSHRFLGRLIGIAYGLPLLIFWLRGMIPSHMRIPLIALLILGAAQGYMGWYMVQSGLVDLPSVSHYRLAAHLALAFTIFAGLVRAALSVWPLPLPRTQVPPSVRMHLWGIGVLYAVTVFWGAYTAGLDAGLIYNDTFPHMGRGLIPEELTGRPDWFSALFYDHAAVQFTHRWLAMLTTLTGLALLPHALMRRSLTSPMALLACAFLMQMLLGVATLFSHVHIAVATLHQTGALGILGLIVITFYSARPK